MVDGLLAGGCLVVSVGGDCMNPLVAFSRAVFVVLRLQCKSMVFLFVQISPLGLVRL